MREQPRAALRGADVRAALAGEQAIRRRTVTVCAWCPSADERTAAARAHGHDVSHDVCGDCVAKLRGQLEARALTYVDDVLRRVVTGLRQVANDLERKGRDA